jgi:TniQ
VRSWIGRVAARYDLRPSELVAGLRNGDELPGWRLASIDWRPDVELEHLLARTARLDHSLIGALRVPVPDPAAWHRRSLAWCPACVREDVERHGETHERADWRLGCYVVCQTHRLLLEHLCAVCPFGRCGFGPVAGRQRLVRGLCRSLVDASEPYPPGSKIDAFRRSRPGLTPDTDLAALSALDLQLDLLRAVRGTTPAGPSWLGMPANWLAPIVRDLAGVFAWPAWFPIATNRNWSGFAASPDILAEMDPPAAAGALGVIGSVLMDMADGCHGRLRAAGAHADLAWFVRGLPDDVRQWLRVLAQGWAPALARRVEEAVDVEERRIHEARVMRDKAARDAAWARKAAPRIRAAAIRRIAARAHRRAVARRERTEQRADRQRPPRG